jgi:putative aldouronate transport system substrate-binding protein
MKRTLFLAFVLAVFVPAAALFASAAGEKTAPSVTQSRPVVFMNYNGDRTSSDAFFKRLHDYIEQQTGVKFISRDVKNIDDFRVQRTAALAAQDQIDAFYVDRDLISEDKNLGLIQDLTDAVNTYGPNMKKLFDSAPGWTGLEPGVMWRPVSLGGRIWAIPDASGTDVGVVLSIRKDWREKLGIGPITTIDEFEAYLRKVKVTDLNGNGKADEIPFNPMYGTDGLEGIASGVVYPFIGVVGWINEWYNPTYIDSKGQVTPGVLHPEFKTFLTRMAQWYKDGLLSPDISTSTTDNNNDLVAANRVGATSSWYSDFYGAWETLVKTVPNAVYEHIDLKGPGGSTAKFAGNNPSQPHWCYTSWSPKDVVNAGIKLQDWFAASKDNYLVQLHGVQNLDWKYTQKGSDAVRPQIMHISDKDYRNYSFLTYSPWNAFVMGGADDWESTHYRDANVQIGKLAVWFKPDWFVAYDFKGTPIEKNRTDAITFINENIANIILNKTPVSEWDSKVAQFRTMWADEFIRGATAQYNKALGK